MLTTPFTGRGDTIHRINAHPSTLLEIYDCIVDNSFSHAAIELSGGSIHNTEDIVVFHAVKKIANEGFSGAELAASVKQKLNFLDSFHFGAQSSVKLIPGTFEEVGHE